MEVPRDFRPCLVAKGLVAQDDPAKLDLVLDPSTAMIGEAWIVIADDPGPVELVREIGQERAGLSRKPLAAERVVEAVAEAIEPRRAGWCRRTAST
jgi:hypothetical protein